MAHVILVMSMWLDGFVTAANPRMEEPTGDGGQVLNEWSMEGENSPNRKYVEENVAKLGAVICGRTTYGSSVPRWGANGPSGAARRPVFLLTHEAPNARLKDSVYTFVTTGMHKALKNAQASAGDQEVAVMGEANVGQQYLKAGLIDEIVIHLVPVLFGAGTRLFEHLGDEHITLEPVHVLDTPSVTHLRYRVVK
jgi:dihydrofolate reductase